MIHQRHAKKQWALLHIVFTAGSWPMVYHTATLIALSLGLLFPSLGAKITTPIIIYTSCYFSGSLCMKRKNTLLFYLLLSFFFFLLVEELEQIWPCCTQWEFASSLLGATISQSVSTFEPYPMNRYISTDPYPCRKCHWMSRRNSVLWTGYSKVYTWKRQPVFPQAIIHPNTSFGRLGW